ncbi:hypothetical protein KCU89_g101, partial [Aureobasidium melanogenum]
MTLAFCEPSAFGKPLVSDVPQPSVTLSISGVSPEDDSNSQSGCTHSTHWCSHRDDRIYQRSGSYLTTHMNREQPIGFYTWIRSSIP